MKDLPSDKILLNSETCHFQHILMLTENVSSFITI